MSCLNGRGLNHAGPGRVAGSHVYVDPGSGSVSELDCVEIVQVGPHFGLARVANNPGMSAARVRIDHSLLNGSGPLTVGQVFLAGPFCNRAGWPKGSWAWPLHTTAPRPHNGGERRGFIHTLPRRVWFHPTG